MFKFNLSYCFKFFRKIETLSPDIKKVIYFWLLFLMIIFQTKFIYIFFYFFISYIITKQIRKNDKYYKLPRLEDYKVPLWSISYQIPFVYQLFIASNYLIIRLYILIFPIIIWGSLFPIIVWFHLRYYYIIPLILFTGIIFYFLSNSFIKFLCNINSNEIIPFYIINFKEKLKSWFLINEDDISEDDEESEQDSGEMNMKNFRGLEERFWRNFQQKQMEENDSDAEEENEDEEE